MSFLAPTAFDALTESMTEITNSVPILGNSFLCVDSSCTAGRACFNFCCSPSPLSKIFFGASVVCGAAGALSSGTALFTSFAGVPAASYLGSFGARAFNRLGKYTLYMGNVTNGNITNVTEIADLMN
jgi:hypothetical protein